VNIRRRANLQAESLQDAAQVVLNLDPALDQHLAAAQQVSQLVSRLALHASPLAGERVTAGRRAIPLDRACRHKIDRVDGGFREASALAGVRVPAGAVGPQTARADGAFLASPGWKQQQSRHFCRIACRITVLVVIGTRRAFRLWR
jgi:hypothetical protein